MIHRADIQYALDEAKQMLAKRTAENAQFATRINAPFYREQIKYWAGIVQYREQQLKDMPL